MDEARRRRNVLRHVFLVNVQLRFKAEAQQLFRVHDASWASAQGRLYGWPPGHLASDGARVVTFGWLPPID